MRFDKITSGLFSVFVATVFVIIFLLLLTHIRTSILSGAAVLYRADYPKSAEHLEWLKTRSARTGEIPDRIRSKEMAYVREQISRTLRKNEVIFIDLKSRGPNNIGGRTRSIAIDVTDENVLLAGGVSGGVWRSQDGGHTWTKTTAPAMLNRPGNSGDLFS